MATRRRMETTPHERRDLISVLPIELKQRLLECLPTRDAARMAMLSTLWKNVWLQHGTLVFDEDFFQSIQNYVAENSTSAVNIINNILLLRGGPVKKFTLNINIKPMLQQSDVERWCSFLSRNGIEELTLHLFVLRTNAPCIFPGVTSLDFESVELNGVASTVPNLEKLAFLGDCEGMDKFEIIAPKLESLCHISGYSGFEPTWFAVQLNRIKTLCLSGGSFLWVRIYLA
nr:F-box/FBD/LRR-repeat protein At1g13570-like [Ipomoea trifida]